MGELIEQAAETQVAQRPQRFATEVTPMQMLHLAVKQGADIEKMKQLMELSERWEANQARKAYVAAMAEFKLTAPEILKDKAVGFESKGGTTSYRHASLGVICEKAITGLAKVGISHAWSYDQTNGIKVTCKLTHSDGHAESTTLIAPPDTSGSKNNIQAIGSTITYLERYTLLGACGLAPKDGDDDGRKAGGDTLTDEQIANIEAMLTEVNANKPAFLRWCRVNEIGEILATNYSAVVKEIERKRERA